MYLVELKKKKSSFEAFFSCYFHMHMDRCFKIIQTFKWKILSSVEKAGKMSKQEEGSNTSLR